MEWQAHNANVVSKAVISVKTIKAFFHLELHLALQTLTLIATHPSHQLAPLVHAEVEVGLHSSNSHLTPEGVCLHNKLGLWRDNTDKNIDGLRLYSICLFIISARENIAREFLGFPGRDTGNSLICNYSF